MSLEIKGAGGSGFTCDALLLNKNGLFWNGSSFETFTAANYSTYLIALTEDGSTGIYVGDFPTTITYAGTFEFFVKSRGNVSSPSQDDSIISTGKIDWTGSLAVSAVPGSMTGSDWRDYCLRGGFKRTDKDTELYEETTDAIQEMRREFSFDEASVENVTTDSIATLGEFKIDIESDMGLLLSLKVEDGTTATLLKLITKAQFDALYPDIDVTNDRGYPEHFTIYAGQIWIGPIPDSTSYVYRIGYSQLAGTITSSTTAVPFTREYRDVLRDNVTSRLYKLMDQFDKSNLYRQWYLDGFEKLKHRERQNSGAGTFNVTPFGM